LVEEAGEAGLQLGEAIWAGVAFPDGEELIAEAAEGAAVLAVAGGVALDFGEPVFAACGGDAAGTAGVSVPEAAVDEMIFLRRGKTRSGAPGRAATRKR
jgi:hypothetical protein